MNKKITVQINIALKNFIPGYIQNRHNDIKNILNALEQKDYETIESVGHKMAGNGGAYGFDQISDIGLCIEKAAKDKNDKEIQKWQNVLMSYLDNLEIIYG